MRATSLIFKSPPLHHGGMAPPTAFSSYSAFSSLQAPDNNSYFFRIAFRCGWCTQVYGLAGEEV